MVVVGGGLKGLEVFLAEPLGRHAGLLPTKARRVGTEFLNVWGLSLGRATRHQLYIL